MSFLNLCLRRPVTVLVLVLTVGLAGVLGLRRMARDVFPPLGIPTLYVAQPFGGMDPAQMEGSLTYFYEYHFLYLTGIEHVESRTIQGASIMKLQFHPGTDMAAAMALRSARLCGRLIHRLHRLHRGTCQIRAVGSRPEPIRVHPGDPRSNVGRRRKEMSRG